MAEITLERVQEAYRKVGALPLTGDFYCRVNDKRCMCPGLVVAYAEDLIPGFYTEEGLRAIDSEVLETALDVDGAYGDGFFAGVDGGEQMGSNPYDGVEEAADFKVWQDRYRAGWQQGMEIRQWLRTLRIAYQVLHGSLYPLNNW